jgi:hypothetical protein
MDRETAQKVIDVLQANDGAGTEAAVAMALVDISVKLEDISKNLAMLIERLTGGPPWTRT